jgi:hypothetical protein
MTIRLIYAAAVGKFEEAFREVQKPIAKAATLAMADTVDQAVDVGRAAISSQGFSSRWQNALRGKAYPTGGSFSMKPAGWIYHKIPYAGVFEQPTTISGDMWLRLSNAPQKDGRDPLTPRLVRKRFGDILSPVSSKGKRLLVVRLPLPSGQDPQSVKVTPTMLRSAIRAGQKSKGKRGTTVQSVPLFHGVSAVSLRKRFNIEGATRQAADSLGSFYVRNFQDE